MKIRPLGSILLLLAVPIFANAHSDTILHQEGETLVGLPAEYAPARFDWDSKILEIAEYRTDLNSFDNIIPFQNDYDVRITASWYHDTRALPPYIALNLHSKERDIEYTILFNLETLDLIRVTLHYQISTDNGIRYVHHELRVQDVYLSEIKRRTTKIE